MVVTTQLIYSIHTTHEAVVFRDVERIWHQLLVSRIVPATYVVCWQFVDMTYVDYFPAMPCYNHQVVSLSHSVTTLGQVS